MSHANHAVLAFSSGLDFTLQSLERSDSNPGEELSVSFTKGYEGTLRPHHGMMVRPIFAVRFFAISFVLGQQTQQFWALGCRFST